MRARTCVFILIVLLTLVLFWDSFSKILALLLQNGYNSYSVLIPLCSTYLLWSRRKQLFLHLRFDPIAGLSATVISTGCWAISLTRLDWFLALEIRYLALLFWLTGMFATIYGRDALKRATFPLALLVFSIPLPRAAADIMITALQSTSTSFAYSLFSLLGTPVFREGFLLHVPGVTIEVAKECSGINSSIALVFTLIVVGYETLHTPSRRFILVLLAMPLSVAKNAVRIVTLTLLAVHVDPSFLTGNLHHKGGVVFYLVALGAVHPIWKLLQRSERRQFASREKNESEINNRALVRDSQIGVAVSNP